ncbi:MAG: coenzyme F420-0:L-glutamate ligase, partial [Chloroflexota bacterium]
MIPGELRVVPVRGLPEIGPGHALGSLIAQALADQGSSTRPGDILVVTHKIVAKAEGAVVD